MSNNNITHLPSSVIQQEAAKDWILYNADCVDTCRALPDKSVHFSIFSPPFIGLYIYSDSERDMGNCSCDDEFYQHFGFLIDELYRLTIPGRLCAVHCKDLPLYFGRDEETGLKDFPGEIVRRFVDRNWTFHSRVTIWKCPVVERERTNNNGLLHKTILRDRSQSRQGMADFLLVFRRMPIGTLMSDDPVTSPDGLTSYNGMECSDPRVPNSYHPSPHSRRSIASNNSINIWRRYAEPVWWDIAQMDVLNYKLGRDAKDEKHICPLQLGVIERAIQLWTNTDDLVLSPFAGIGSEGFVAVKMGRKFIGIELKESYWKQAVSNLKIAESEKQNDLFTNTP
jgi:hypothetical protein